jgi:SH3-like domain-containing protein
MKMILAGLLALISLATVAHAADYKSIADNGVILYDAPSVKAKRLYVVSRDYPVEVIVSVDNWVKVRDQAGELTWVERKFLSDRRTVVITAQQAEVRQSASEGAPLAFRVQQGVAMDIVEIGSDGWARVRHRDGQSGFVRVRDGWGF